MLHSLFLRVGLELKADLSVLMHAVRRFVVAVMAEPYHKPITPGLVSDRLAATPYVMPF